MRELIRETMKLRRRAIQAYIEQRVTLRRKELRRETDEEVRAVLRAHDLGNVAFD